MAGNYTLNWSDDILKPPFTLHSESIDLRTTSLQLTGYDWPNWGENLVENLVLLLEHFAAQNPPLSATLGQTWFNSKTKYLNIYIDGGWRELKKRDIESPLAPTTQAYIGDLWYDTTNNLLMVYTNQTEWVSVCSQC